MSSSRYTSSICPHTDKAMLPTAYTKVNPISGYFPSDKPFAIYYCDYLEKYFEYWSKIEKGEEIEEEEEQLPEPNQAGMMSRIEGRSGRR